MHLFNITRYKTILTIVLSFTLFSSAFANSHLSELSDFAVYDLRFRKDAKVEIQQRLRTKSTEEQEAFFNALQERPPSPIFPSEFSDIDLCTMLTLRDDLQVQQKAIGELKKRYIVDPSKDPQTLKTALLQVALSLPIVNTDTPEDINLSSNLDLLTMSLIVGEFLPEDITLDYLVAVYLDRDLPKGVDNFLRVVSHAKLRGPKIVLILGSLNTKLEEEIILQRSQSDLSFCSPDLIRTQKSLIAHLGTCGNAGFEELLKTNWEGSTAGIRAMGIIATTQSRDLLFDLYAQTSNEQPVKRLDILSSLTNPWLRTQDNTIRDFLREELKKFYSDSTYPTYYSNLNHAVWISGYSQDTFWLEHLQALQASIKMGQIHAEEDNELERETNKDALLTNLTRTIKKLEKSTQAE